MKHFLLNGCVLFTAGPVEQLKNEKPIRVKNCNFEYVSEDLLNGECNFVLHNRSGKDLAFELEFLDSFFMEDEVRMESLMNLAGPYIITIEANRKKSIYLRELLELSDVPKHIDGGTSNNIHFKLIEGGKTRTL